MTSNTSSSAAATASATSGKPKATFDAPFADVLLELGAKDERVVVLAADLARYVDVLPFRDAYPDRFFNLGMAEANLIGMASGLAKSGLKPIVVTYGVFITRRAYDQVAMSLTTGPTGVVLVGFLPGITSRFRASHQPVDDMALMVALPAMGVIDPAGDEELKDAVRQAVDADHPTYIRAVRGHQPALAPKERRPKALLPVRLGGEDAKNADIAMVSTGLGTRWAMEAAELLRKEGRSVSILHMPVLKPFDGEAALAFCRGRKQVITVENHIAHGGLHAALARAVVLKGLGVRVIPAAVPDAWPPSGSVDFIRREIGLGAEQIAELAVKGAS